MTVLITGAAGQDGQYLSRLCSEQGGDVIATSQTGLERLLNVADFRAVESMICDSKPDYVFHLAARSSLSHDALFKNHDAVVTGSMNILEACHRHCRHARIFLPGSALQFDNTELPINEETPFHAGSPYAAARIYMTYLARYYRSLGLLCYVGYLFHHDSPLRSSGHLSQRIAQAAVRIAAGSKEKLEVGSLSVEKEWTFAGDTVRAIWMMVNQDRFWETVIGSGRAFPVRNWVDACFQAAGTKGEVQEISGYRPDFKRLVSNPSRIQSLGWEPQVSLEELAKMMVESQRV
jgi:GDPmannose 4,6-dehydratase